MPSHRNEGEGPPPWQAPPQLPRGYWTEERLGRLIELWPAAPREAILTTFPEATWEAIAKAVQIRKLALRGQALTRATSGKAAPNRGGKWVPLAEKPTLLISSMGPLMNARTGRICVLLPNGGTQVKVEGRSRFIAPERRALVLFGAPKRHREETAHHPIMAAADAAVARWLEPADRADVVQDIVVAVLMGDLRFEDIPRAARRFVSRHNTAAGRYKTFSLDQPMFGDSTRSWTDRLADDVVRF